MKNASGGLNPPSPGSERRTPTCLDLPSTRAALSQIGKRSLSPDPHDACRNFGSSFLFGVCLNLCCHSPE